MTDSVHEPGWFNHLYLRWLGPIISPQTYKGLREKMRALEQREKMTLNQNLELQWQSLTRLLQHAYDSTPFYRERFDTAGVHPSQIASPEDIKRIPLLTREDLRNHLEELWSRRYRREELLTAATGGTTDTPIALLRSPESMKEKLAVQLQFDTWAGMWPGDKVFLLWGARIDYAENPSWRWRIYDRYLMRRVWAPTSLFNERVLETYRETLNRFRPRVIYAYPTPLALFCEYLRDSRRPIHGPKAAICTAEPLLAQQRQTIQEVLGCPVFEHYGARDFGMLAAECESHQGLHLNPESAYVEFQPIEGAEVPGLNELLVTDLLNYGMPLIRYKVNDCSMPGPEKCSCGRGYSSIQPIAGRTVDNFRLSNGDIVPGVALTNRVLKVCPGLKKVQVIQESLVKFRVRYVPGTEFTGAEMDLLRQNLRIFLPGNLEWNFERVGDIEREPSGKTRFCISLVSEAQLKSAASSGNRESKLS